MNLSVICDATSGMVTSFAAPEVWQWLIQFFIIATALLLGNVLRRKVPFLKRSLVPTALIAGAIILIFKAFPACSSFVNKSAMEIVTYHALGLGFVALALKNNKVESQSSAKTIIETGTLTASTYMLQGIVGLLVSVPLFYFGGKLFYAAGLLLPMGYGQGPGQALNFGKIYGNWAAEQGISFAGTDFALSIAATGFLVGSVVGVIFLNVLRRRGVLKIKHSSGSTIRTLEDFEGSNEIPDTESVDKLTIQLCMVLFVYFLVFLFTNWIQGLELGDFGTKTLKPLLWGFNFLLGTLFGLFFKWSLNGFKKAKLVRREYVNNYLLTRISGFCFDVMIVAGTAAISFDAFGTFVVPFIIICTLGALATFFYVLKISKHLYPEYPYEGFFSMFGMLTGTASNGMILLREIDPKFDTPAANNLVLQTFPAIVLGFPVLLILGFAPKSFTNACITLAVLIVLLIVLTMFLMRSKIFKRRKR